MSASSAAVLLTVASVAVAAFAVATPAKDTFHGRITDGTGKLAGDHGNVTLLVHVAPSGQTVRPVTLGMTGPACGRTRHCLRLIGTLSGTISTHPTTIPDAGRRYTLAVSGAVAALGHASARGLLAGAGFIREGRETLTLKLRTKLGDVTITATSPKVPGFTSP